MWFKSKLILSPVSWYQVKVKSFKPSKAKNSVSLESSRVTRVPQNVVDDKLCSTWQWWLHSQSLWKQQCGTRLQWWTGKRIVHSGAGHNDQLLDSLISSIVQNQLLINHVLKQLRQKWSAIHGWKEHRCSWFSLVWSPEKEKLAAEAYTHAAFFCLILFIILTWKHEFQTFSVWVLLCLNCHCRLRWKMHENEFNPNQSKWRRDKIKLECFSQFSRRTNTVRSVKGDFFNNCTQIGDSLEYLLQPSWGWFGESKITWFPYPRLHCPAIPRYPKRAHANLEMSSFQRVLILSRCLFPSGCAWNTSSRGRPRGILNRCPSHLTRLLSMRRKLI